MKLVGDKISYVRNPFARRSFPCLGLALLALALTAASLGLSVARAGQGGPNTGALGFSGLVAGIFSLWYGFLAFREEERNYILARIGVAVAVVLVIVWIMIIITGIV